MPREPVIVNLVPEQFRDRVAIIATHAGLTAAGFRYGSGVAGLRISNRRGEIMLLPFQGQQIWDASFLGRRLTMRSMFDAPVPTRDYLANYGAFFLHCGASAMGNPGPKDTHPLHGELPNAPYGDVQLIIGDNGDGPYMALTGRSQHTIAFNNSYAARPVVRLQDDATHVDVEMEVENLKGSVMELMYMGHINFRPVDDGRIVDTVRDDDRGITARQELPEIFDAESVDHSYRDMLAARPALHRTLAPGQPILPELVMSLRVTADADGWAHALQVHPDGTADFVSHRPDELPYAVRWITRGPDQDALGLVLPATAESEGYVSAKARGRLVKVPAHGRFRCGFRFGVMDRLAAEAAEQKIAAVRSGAAPGQ